MFNYPWGDMHSLNLGWFLLEFKAWIEKIQEYLDNGGGTSENLANVIAPVFNAANSYLTGDYVLYNDELYKALEPVPPGTWNPYAWARCLVTEEMGSSSSGVDNVARLMIAGQYSNTYNYQKYAICRYTDKLWMCNTNLPTGGEEWTPSHWDEITVGAGLTGLRRSVETLSNDISNLDSAISDVADDVSDLNTALTPLKTAPALTSSDNLNDLYGENNNGFYYLGSGVQNAPTNYAGMINITNANGECFQFVIGAFNVISFRYRAGNPASWSEWREMYSPESVTLTPSSTYVNNTTELMCQKIGRIVMFTGTLVLKASAQTGDVLMTGFPIPAKNVTIFGNVIDSPNTADRGKNGRFVINTSGQLIPWYNTWGAAENGEILLFNAVYFI